jgi:protein-tyrosine phosphatase
MDIGPLLQQLAGMGMRAIVTHPERYPWDEAQIAKLWQWRRSHRVQIQITAGSLLGAFGERAAELSWHWLGHGLVDLVASDAHDVERRPPRMREVWNAIAQRVGDAVAMRVMCTTPARLLQTVPLGAWSAAMSAP